MRLAGEHMANNATIAVDVQVQGLKPAITDAEKLKATLEQTAAQAATIRIPVATGAARQGVAARAAAAGPGNTASDTNLSRGIGGQTGASGRDFAAQAQGLGGLVHVYATFAANLYAVSAAYGALSKAADTTNLIKGLDQLGAASGRSLGSLAKAMVAATDGAISLRQAMTSTAMATAGGMTSDAILRMTEVAKKASLALGRDMGDSMDRLTKGIVKIQPELLDELGIMTRVIPAQQAYARSIGKSVEALTDFEKRQAFSNAVLTEGEKKFSQIEIDSSPYAKLSAAINNLSQNMLELINTGLGPIITLLASSPTALTMAVATLAGVLLKQAIPALGQYKEGIEKLRLQTLQRVIEQNNIVAESGKNDAVMAEQAKQAFLIKNKYLSQTAENQVILMAKADKLADTVAEAERARGQGLLGHETVMNKIRDKNLADAAAANIKYNVSQTQSAYGMVAAYRELNDQIKISKTTGQQIATGKTGANGIAETVAAPQIGMMGAGMARVAGVAGILRTGILLVIEAFSGWLLVIGVVLMGIDLLIDKFSKTTAINKKLTEASEDMTRSFEMVGKTLDNINAKPFLEQISVESLQAKANEFNQLTASMAKAKSVYDERSKSKQGWLEKLQDTDWGALFETVFIGDGDKADVNKTRGWFNRTFNPVAWYDEIKATTSTAKNQLTKALTEDIVGAFKNVKGTGVGETSVRDLIKSTFAISFTDVTDLQEKLGNIPDQLISKGPAAAKAIEEISHSLNNAASAATSMVAAWDTASKSFDTALGTLTVTDALGKLGLETIDVGIKMTKALEGPVEALASFEAITKDVNKLRFLSPETAKALLQERDTLQEMGKNQKEYNDQLEKAKKLKEERATKLEEISQGGKVGGSAVNAQKALLEASNRDIALLEKRKAIDTEQFVKSSSLIKAQGEMYAFGGNLLNASILQAFQKASIALQQSYLSDSTSKAGIEANAKLQKELIEADISNIQATMSLATATRNLTFVQEELAIQGKRKEINSSDFTGDKPKELALLQGREIALGIAKGLSGKTYSQLVELTNPKKGASPEIVSAAMTNIPAAAQTASGQAQIAAKRAQQTGIDLETQKKTRAQILSLQLASYDVDLKDYQYQKAKLDNQQRYLPYLDAEALQSKQTLDHSILINEQSKARLPLIDKIEAIEKRIAAVGKDKALSAAQKLATTKALQGDLIDANKVKENFELGVTNDLGMEAIRIQQDEFANQKARYTYVIGREKDLRDQKQATAEADLAVKDINLSNMSNTKAFLPSELAALETKNKLANEELQLIKIKDTISTAAMIKRRDLEMRMNAIDEAGGAKSQGYQTLLKEKWDLDAAETAQIATETKLSTARSKSIMVVGKYAEAMDKLVRANNIASMQDQVKAADLANKEAMKQISPESAASAQYGLGVNAANRTYAESTKGAQTEYDKLNTAKAAGQAYDEKALANATATLTYAQQVYGQEIALLDTQKQGVLQQAALNVQLEEMARITNMAAGFAESMTTAFGDVGAAIGGMAEAMVKFGTDRATNEIAYLALLEQRKNITGTEAEKAAQKAVIDKNLMDLSKKDAIQQSQNTTVLIGGAKKLFDEKSKGFKLLGALEKASAMNTAFLQAKEIAMKIAGYATDLAAYATAMAAKMGIDIPGIYSSFMVWLGPAGPAAASAAMAALGIGAGMALGGLMEDSNTSNMYDMTGKTSEERQKNQGTGGVFGDTSAKSTTIVDSIEMLAKNSIEGLNYDNEMLKAMRRIADSVTGAAKALYAAPGVRKGTGFGTSEASSSTPNFGLGKDGANALGAGIGYLVGGFLGAGLGSMLGGAVNNVLGGIFGGGSSSSNKITSAGIELKGTFKQVMDDTAGSIRQFKDVLTTTHTDGGWFGSSSDSSSMAHQTQELGSKTSQAIADIFGQANEMFLILGKKTNVSATQIQSILENYDISMPIDLMNKTGQEFIDELNAVVGEKISGAAERIFTGFEKYRNFGEDYLGTVLRVVDANERVNQSLLYIGHAFSIISRFDISESLVKAAGGLENFQTQASFFHDNFLSATEKITPIQKGVTDQLVKLGISTAITRDQYKQMVIVQDLSTQSGRDMYQSLMELAPGFDMVTKAISDFNSKALDLEAKIYDLLGEKAKALAISRNKELEALDESLRPRQLYINALTDEIALRDKLKAAYDSSNKSVNAAIASLDKYKTSLLAGAASTLTPAEKYANATAIFKATAIAAVQTITTASSAADIATRDEAVAKLSSVSDSFLANSKEMNAGSAQYQTDLGLVTTAVTDATTAMGAQLTDSQKQLGFLDTIAAATQTTADILTEYLLAKNVSNSAQSVAATSGSIAATITIPGHAEGGLASGLSLVGEKGPELVDFKTTSRVYSNKASNDLFSTKELVEEIKALRNEVADLRADQKEQTKHLITSTYDANIKNAEAITTANQDALDKQNWNTRSKVMVA